jgi:hypothetical protein
MLPRLLLGVFGALFLAAPGAFAQEYSPVRWYLMGGANPPVGNTSDILQTGWNVGFAVTWREPGHPIGLRLDVNYAANNATRALQNAGAIATGLNITGGWADIWSASLNLEAQHLFFDHLRLPDRWARRLLHRRATHRVRLRLCLQPVVGLLLLRHRRCGGSFHLHDQIRLERRHRHGVPAPGADAIHRSALYPHRDLAAAARIHSSHDRVALLRPASALENGKSHCVGWPVVSTP